MIAIECRNREGILQGPGHQLNDLCSVEFFRGEYLDNAQSIIFFGLFRNGFVALMKVMDILEILHVPEHFWLENIKSPRRFVKM
jgi:hypothetical protein